MVPPNVDSRYERALNGGSNPGADERPEPALCGVDADAMEQRRVGWIADIGAAGLNSRHSPVDRV